MAERICSFPGCSEPHRRWGYCNTHSRRFKKHGDASIVLPLSGRPRASVVGYASAHYRLKRDRGRAAEHLCIRCGAQAAAWAYRHDDPNVEVRVEKGMAYSLRVEDYDPMCDACHISYDEIVSKRGSS